jgi:hypothetical protein
MARGWPSRAGTSHLAADAPPERIVVCELSHIEKQERSLKVQ